MLVICNDEHDPRHSGFGGSALVRTPNLDRLAERGTVFTRAYTPSPICVPARASMATGRYVHDHRFWDNALAYDGSIPAWGHRLQAAGTGVRSIGKLHYRSAEDDTGFDSQTEAVHIAAPGQLWGSVRDPLPEQSDNAGLFRKIGAGESAYNRFDRRVADAAVAWLHERAARRDPAPAAAFVGFVAPHFPLIVPQRYLDLYPLEAIPSAKLRPQDGYVRHPWVERQARFSGLDGELGTDERRRLATACYFALITYVDALIGSVLDAVDSLGLRNETLIVFTSDHGDNLGARGMWNKSLLYRESTGVPLILSGPGIPARTCATNVSLLDLFPTILAGAGVAPAEADALLPGRSLLDIAGAENDPDRIAFSEYHAIGSPSAGFLFAQDRYVYHHYAGYVPELFDIENDPEQLHDLRSERPDLVADFAARVRTLIDPDAVDRRAKDDQNALVERHGGREAVLSMHRFGATPVPQ